MICKKPFFVRRFFNTIMGTVGQVDEWMDEQMDGQTDRLDGWADGWTDIS